MSDSRFTVIEGGETPSYTRKGKGVDMWFCAVCRHRGDGVQHIIEKKYLNSTVRNGRLVLGPPTNICGYCWSKYQIITEV